MVRVRVRVTVRVGVGVGLGIAVELEPALRQGARPDALVRVRLRVSGLGLA